MPGPPAEPRSSSRRIGWRTAMRCSPHSTPPSRPAGRNGSGRWRAAWPRPPGPTSAPVSRRPCWRASPRAWPATSRRPSGTSGERGTTVVAASCRRSSPRPATGWRRRSTTPGVSTTRRRSSASCGRSWRASARCWRFDPPGACAAWSTRSPSRAGRGARQSRRSPRTPSQEPVAHYRIGLHQLMAVSLARIDPEGAADRVVASIEAARADLAATGCPRCGAELDLFAAEVPGPHRPRRRRRAAARGRCAGLEDRAPSVPTGCAAGGVAEQRDARRGRGGGPARPGEWMAPGPGSISRACWRPRIGARRPRPSAMPDASRLSMAR